MEQVHPGMGNGIQTIKSGLLPGGGSHGAPQFGMFNHPDDGLRQTVRIPERNQQAVLFRFIELFNGGCGSL